MHTKWAHPRWHAILEYFSSQINYVEYYSSFYGWAFGLPEKFGSGISGFENFGFWKIEPEIRWQKPEPDNSGTRKFRVRVRVTRTTRIADLNSAMHMLYNSR